VVKRNRGAAGIDHAEDPVEIAGGDLGTEPGKASGDAEAERGHTETGNPHGSRSGDPADDVASADPDLPIRHSASTATDSGRDAAHSVEGTPQGGPLSPLLANMYRAGFNRRMRKTARPVVWEGDGAQSPSLDLITGESGLAHLLFWWGRLQSAREFCSRSDI
jgi:hypothetical protein